MEIDYKKYSLKELSIESRKSLMHVTMENGIMRYILCGMSNTTVYVALDGGIPVGLAMVRPDKDETYPVDIFIKPTYRRKGIGTKLMYMVKEDIGDALVDVAPFDSAGHNFYERTLNVEERNKQVAGDREDAEANPFLAQLLGGCAR